MDLLGLAGADPDAREALARDLLSNFRECGISMSLVFLDDADRDYDQPGKDSHRHLEAGAVETALVGKSVYAFSGRRPDLGGLIARLAPVDLVLVIADKPPDVPLWVEICSAGATLFSVPSGESRSHTFSTGQMDALCAAIMDATSRDKSRSK